VLQTDSTGGHVGGFLITVIKSLVTVAIGALFAGLLGARSPQPSEKSCPAMTN